MSQEMDQKYKAVYMQEKRREEGCQTDRVQFVDGPVVQWSQNEVQTEDVTIGLKEDSQTEESAEMSSEGSFSVVQESIKKSLHEAS